MELHSSQIVLFPLTPFGIQELLRKLLNAKPYQAWSDFVVLDRLTRVVGTGGFHYTGEKAVPSLVYDAYKDILAECWGGMLGPLRLTVQPAAPV